MPTGPCRLPELQIDNVSKRQRWKQLQELNNAVLYFTWYLICFSMVLLCLERLFVTVYRPTTAGIANDPTTCTLIVAIVVSWGHSEQLATLRENRDSIPPLAAPLVPYCRLLGKGCADAIRADRHLPCDVAGELRCPQHADYIRQNSILFQILVVLYRTNRKWRNTKLTKPLETKCSFEENMLVSAVFSTTNRPEFPK